jgi:hypothetical protein
MKTLMACFSLLFLLGEGNFQSKPPNTDLKDSLESLKQFVANRNGGAETLESSGPNGCEVKITHHHAADPKTGMTEFWSSLSFSFADVDPNGIEIKPANKMKPILRDGDSAIWYHITNYLESIQDDDTMFHTHYPRSKFYFVAADKDAMKVAELVKQIALLCGGKVSHLPAERIYEFDVSTPTVTPKDQPFVKPFLVRNREPYQICREISHDVKVDGSSAFMRYVTDRTLFYDVAAYPDPILGTPSQAVVHVKILETLDPIASKCGKLTETFDYVEALGPSTGWTSRRGYIEGPGSDFLEVVAPEEGDKYCTHKVVVYTVTGGDRSLGVTSWDDRSMKIIFSEQQKGFGGPGIHFGVVLLVRYLKNTNVPGCTAPPPAGYNTRHQRLKQVKLPDGSLFFEFDPNGNPSGTPH